MYSWEKTMEQCKNLPFRTCGDPYRIPSNHCIRKNKYFPFVMPLLATTYNLLSFVTKRKIFRNMKKLKKGWIVRPNTRIKNIC